MKATKEGLFLTSPSDNKDTTSFTIHTPDGQPTSSAIQIDPSTSTVSIISGGQVVDTRDFIDPFVRRDTLRALATADLVADPIDTHPVFGPGYPVIPRRGEIKTADFRASELARTITDLKPGALRSAWIAIQDWRGHPPPDGITKARHILEPNKKGKKARTGFGIVIKSEPQRTKLTIIDMTTGKPVGDEPTAITHVTRASKVTNANMASAVVSRGLVRGPDGRTPVWSSELPRTGARRS